MDGWTLQIELNGEWEECIYTTRLEALAAFIALAEDYQSDLTRAVLYSPQAVGVSEAPVARGRPDSKFLN